MVLSYFVVDEGDGTYNAFSSDMFDKDGYLEGYKNKRGYHINDYEIIAWFKTWDEAADYAEEMNNQGY